MKRRSLVQDILEKIDGAVFEHDVVLRHTMSHGSLSIDPWLIAGIIEGDGFTSTTLVIRKDIVRAQSRITVGVSALTKNVIILELVQYFFTSSPYSLNVSTLLRPVNITEGVNKKGQGMSYLRFESVYVFGHVEENRRFSSRSPCFMNKTRTCFCSFF